MLSVHGRGIRIELHTGQTSESLLTGFHLGEQDCQNPAEWVVASLFLLSF